MSAASGVVFDKDGTLVDLDARWAPFFWRTIDGVAARCDDPALVPALRSILGVDDRGLVLDGPAAVETPGQIAERVIVELLTRGIDRERATDVVAAVAADTAFGPIEPLGDIASALRNLRDRELPIGIATSDGRSNTIHEVETLGIAALVDTMRCGDDDGPVKPDPAVLTGIATEWGMESSAILFVGDSQQDLMTARAAGAPFVARCDPARLPSWTVDADAVIADIDELVIE